MITDPDLAAQEAGGAPRATAYTDEMRVRAQERIRRRRESEDADVVYRQYAEAVYAGLRRYVRELYWERQATLVASPGHLPQEETKPEGGERSSAPNATHST